MWKSGLNGHTGFGSDCSRVSGDGVFCPCDRRHSFTTIPKYYATARGQSARSQFAELLLREAAKFAFAMYLLKPLVTLPPAWRIVSG